MVSGLDDLSVRDFSNAEGNANGGEDRRDDDCEIERPEVDEEVLEELRTVLRQMGVAGVADQWYWEDERYWGEEW